MTEFTLLYCPICGVNRSEKHFKKPYKLMPFARIVRSLGRGTLQTIRVITSPFKFNLVYLKRRLLLTVKGWYAHGIINNDDIDKYLVDMVGEFNQWCRDSQYEEMTFRGYVKTPATTYQPESTNNNIKNNARRIRTPWL